MVDLFQLIGRIIIDTSGAEDELEDFADSASGSGDKVSGIFQKVGAAIGAYLTVDALSEFGQGCLDAAASASAASSQFTQVFGDLEGQAAENLANLSQSSGIIEERLKGSYTQIAAFAKTTGMETEDALGLADRAMVAVADSAAFYDRSLEETTESLQSFLKGNYENDAALGLSCTETTRNAAANELYGKSFKNLSEEQKQLTLLKMVEDANKLSGAMGQATRESETWGNVTGNLSQAWVNLKAALGSGFLDYTASKTAQLAKIVQGFVPKVEALVAKIPDLVNWLKKNDDIITALEVVLGAGAIALWLYTSGITASTVATTIMTAATTALSAVVGFLTAPVTLVVLAIGALVGALIVAYNRSEKFRAIVNSLKEKLSAAFERIKEAAVGLKEKISEAWDGIKEKCSEWGETIKSKLGAAWENVKEKASPLIAEVKDNLSTALETAKEKAAAFKDAASEVWGNVKEKCSPLVSEIKDSLVGAFNDAKEAVGKAKEELGFLQDKFQPVADIISGALGTALKDAVEWLKDIGAKAKELAEGALLTLRDNLDDFAAGALQSVRDGLEKARDFFQQLGEKAEELWANLDPLVTLIRDNLLATLENLKEPLGNIKEAFGGIGDALSVAWDAIKNELLPALKELWDLLSPLLLPILQAVAAIFGGLLATAIALVTGLINGIVSALDGLVRIFSGLVEIVSGVFQLIVGLFTGNTDLILQALQSIWDGVCNVFGGLWDAISGFLVGFVDGVVGFFMGLWDTLVGHSIVPDTIDGIVECFAGLWDKVKGLVSAFKDGVVEKFTSLKDAAVEKFTALKNSVTEKATAAKNAVSGAWDNIKTKTSSAFESAKTKASTAFSAIKTKISDGVSGAYTKVKEKFDAIKKKITDIMDTVKSTVSNAIEKVKGAFNFSWSLPKLKLPHISVSGGKAPYGIGGQGSLPKFSIEWYKTAMNSPKILESPTIFGYNHETGNLLGGGDAGSEVVAGTNTLMGMITNAVAEQNAPLAYYLQKLVAMLADYMPQVLESMERDIRLDSGALVGALASPMDEALGKIRSRKARGW